MPAISLLLGRPQRMLLIEVGLTITFIVIAGITTAGGFITELIRLAAARSGLVNEDITTSHSSGARLMPRKLSAQIRFQRTGLVCVVFRNHRRDPGRG